MILYWPFFFAWVALFSEAPCDRRHFLFYYQAQEQITQMVFRPVNMLTDVLTDKFLIFLSVAFCYTTFQNERLD